MSGTAVEPSNADDAPTAVQQVEVEEQQGNDDGRNVDDAAPVSPPSEPIGGAASTDVAADEAKHGDDDGSRHVKFNNEVSLASLIFHEEPIDETPAEVSERLYQQGVAQMNARMKRMEEKKAQEEAATNETAFKPTISKAAKDLPSHKNFSEFLGDQAEKNNYRRKVWEKKKAKHISDAMEEATFKPEMGKRSAKLVEKMEEEKRYRGPIRGWKKHYDHFLVKEQEAAAASPIRRVGDGVGKVSSEVFEKLYRESEMRAAAQDIIAQAQAEEASSLFQPDRTLGSLSLASSIGSRYRDAEYRSPNETVNTLIEKGEQTKRKIEEQRRRREMAEASSFTPKTNKLSQKMVQQWTERRVSAPRSAGSRQEQETLSPEITGVPAPKPKATFDVDIFYSKVHRQTAEREAKLHAIKAQKEQAALAECSFRPRTSGSMGARRGDGSSGASTPRSVPRGGGTPRMHIAGMTGNRSSASASSSARRTPRTTRGGSAMTTPREEQSSYVLDMVAVPSKGAAATSSSPPTARTFLDDDGETDLSNLEAELQGVIAEWSNIDSL